MTIKIYRDAIAPEDLEALQALLDEAGLEFEIIDGPPDETCESEVGVVVLYPESDPLAPEVAAVVKGCANAGRVFGVWPKETQAGAVPHYFDDYGTGTCVWSAGEIRRVIKNPVFSSPNSDERPVPSPTQKDC